MEDQRLENRSEESQTGETDHTDRHVARLDGGVEQDPVQPEFRFVVSVINNRFLI